MQLKIVSLLAVVLLGAVPLRAQTNPTGTISGKVVDQDGLAVPGATVTVQSPALQGTRSATTSANGDYIIPFLPAGEYEVTTQLTGFKTVKETTRVSPSASVTMSPVLTVSRISETVTVVGHAAEEFGQKAEVATNFKQDLFEKLPTNRTFIDGANLSPGVQNSGPNGALAINGAMSFESLYIVNGVVVNENIRGQALDLFIEDALQETTVSTAAISAEFGRFQGGVVQAITKSGGNEFSGSYRIRFDNNDWVALTPYPGDHPAPGRPPARTNKILKTQEVTLGGPIVKDRLWFFGAGRFTGDRVQTQTTSFTNLPYDDATNQQRYEGKLTWSLNSNHTFKGAFTKIKDTENGNKFGTIMDLASLVNRATPQDLLSANYTGIISPKFFVEGQYSRRRFTFENSGSPFTDLIKGTLLRDRSRGNARYNSPTFCGVCGTEKRDNQNVTAKATYFASTGSLGSHNVVVGFDLFDDKRFANNHQSGSDYRIFTTSAIIQGSGASTQIFPVLTPNSTYIRWTPIFVNSIGNRFRTYSGYINDAWSYDKHWSFNVGVRYDKNGGVDSQGRTVVKDAAFSPRLSATFDPNGKGNWTLNAAYGHYVAAIANSVGDSGSAGGQPATIDFTYLGPSVNAGNPASPVSTADALTTLFNWFNANGGTTRPTRSAPVIPGLNAHIGNTLKSPHTQEVTLGLSRRLGTRGAVRLDGVYRKYHDFYVTRIDTSTGKVSDQFGQIYDLGIVENNNSLIRRSYRGLNLQASYRPSARVGLGGNYTLGEVKGNFDGESGTGGPSTSGVLSYPEYLNLAWNSPDGDLNADIRHKARLWATVDIPTPAALGSFTLGGLQYFSSGAKYGALGQVDSTPYVKNPGYVTPPDGGVDYWFTARDAFSMEKLWRSDLSLNYEHKLGYKQARLFFRGTMVNVFNRHGLTNLFGGRSNDLDTGCGTQGCIDTTVLTNNTTSTLAPFNPFTTAPVEGVNWRKGTNFGKPTSRYAYQTPRTYQFSVGFRF